MKIRRLMILAIGLSLSLTASADDNLSFSGLKFDMNAEQIAKLGGGDTEYSCASELNDKQAEARDHPEEDREEWVEFFTKSNGDVFFFDKARVAKNGKQISVWTRVRYKTSIMAASSYQNLIRLDCSENSETVLQDTFYTDKNWAKPAMATNTNEKPKKAVQKNSATEQLINILCKDVS